MPSGTAAVQVKVLDAWQVAAGASRRSLRKLAHRVEFDYSPRPGYLYFRSRAISSRTNDNHDTFPAAEIEAAYQTFLGKPLFVNHHNSNHRRARGVIIAAALHKDRNPDGSPDTWAELLHELDAQRFPVLAKAILTGRVNRTSMGVDVEWSKCSACGNKATTPAEYCEHLPAKKGLKIRKRGKDGRLHEEIIHEVCYKLAFFENSVLVEDPADPTAYITGKPDGRGLQMAASKKTADHQAIPHPGKLQGGSCRLSCTYGGTHCAVCHEPVAINLHKATPEFNGGWHHSDSWKRDHPALPADPEGVIASIPAQIAAKDQARTHVQDVLERQGLPRRQPKGLPPDPFLAHFTGASPDLLAHFQRTAITGEHAEPGDEIFAAPAGRSPVQDHFEHMLDQPDRPAHGAEWEHPHVTAPDHGPYYVTRDPGDPDMREGRYHLLDRHGRDASSGGGGYKGGMFGGDSGAIRDWHRLTFHEDPDRVKSPRTDAVGMWEAHRNNLRQHPPQFPHSRIDPRDEEIAQRPDARVHKPEDYSPSDEYHGSYEVVKHPETSRFHVVDNAGRHAGGPYDGFKTQMQAERSRDYVEQRQRSKEIGKGLADSIFGKGMEILDPGGTEESRQSDRNLQTGQELMNRYAGGRGRIKYDPDDEGGQPYYEHEHRLPNGRASGWYSKHYGGSHAEIFHRATGDEAHELLQLPQHPDQDAHPYGLHPDFDHHHMEQEVNNWHNEDEEHGGPGEGHGTRSYLEQSDPRIRRWKQRYPQGKMEPPSRPGGFMPQGARRYADPGDHPWFQANPVSVENLLSAWQDTTPTEREAGRRWFSDAHHVAKAIAGGDAARGAGLLSAYSPRTSWPLNLFHASRAHVENRAPGPGEGPIMGSHQRAASRILAGEHHSAVFLAPKTQDFAHLIEHGGQAPDTPPGAERVVVDRHALSAAAGRRMTDADLQVSPIKRRPYYEHVAEKYRAGARIAGEDPEKFMAGLWERQQRVNATEDTAMRTGLAKGRAKARQTLDSKAWAQWGEHSRQQGIPLDSENMHMHASRRTAAGQEDVTVPAPVDTLQQEACPVCGDAEVYTGQRCPVCGYVSPPSLFRDPDIEHSREVREQLEENKQELGMPQGPADEQQGSWPDAEDQMAHPDQIAPDGVAAPAEGEPGEPPPDGDDPSDPDEDETELLSPEELEEQDPGQLAQQGEQDMQQGQVMQEQGEEEEQGAEDEAAAENGAPPADEDDDEAEEDEEPGKGQDSGRRKKGSMGNENARTAAAAAQRAQYEQVLAENRGLRAAVASLQHQLNFMARLAGCEGEMAAIHRQAVRQHQADVMNPGQPVPDPPEAPPSETTEQALQAATQGDPSRPGTEPGSVTGVPAAQTTTPITPGVEMQTPPATNLQDVTAPVQGTNPSEDGGVPLSQRRIETDVRIDPDPLKAGATQGVGGQPSPNGTAFPWILDGGPQQRQASAAPQGEQDASRRTFASIRLAKLRVAAGMVRGEELEVAAHIERDAGLTTHDIEREIQVLSSVRQAAPARPRGRVPARTAARTGPSLAAPPAPQMAYTAAAAPGLEDNGEDIFMDF